MADTTVNPKILLVSKAAFFDIDKLGSAIILGKLLADKHSTTVDIHFQVTPPMQDLTRVISPRSVNFIEQLDADYFTISIDRGNAKVTEVKWEETKDKIKLLIFTEKGDVNTARYAMTPGQPHYDQLFAFGIKTEEDVHTILGEYKGLWEAAKTFNVDIRNENSRFAQTNSIHPDAKSYAELIVHVAEELELEIKPDEATELLACIYWKTNSLRNKYTTSLSLNHVNKLFSKGADLSTATYKIFSSLSLIEAKARQEIYNNLVVNSDKIAFSRIGRDTAQQLLKAHPIFPEKNPLYHLRDAHASFVLIPTQESRTLVLAAGQEDKVNIKRLFGQFNFVGDSLQAELTFDLNTADTEREINRILDQKVFKRGSTSKDHPNQPVPTGGESPRPKQAITPVTTTDNPQDKKEQRNTNNTDSHSNNNNTTKDRQSKPQTPTTPAKPVKIAETKLPPNLEPELQDADPLKPANEELQPQPAPADLNLAPVNPAGAAFGDFGPIGGFGGNGNPGNSDPLPSAA